jgi:hypothetical protein
MLDPDECGSEILILLIDFIMFFLFSRQVHRGDRVLCHGESITREENIIGLVCWLSLQCMHIQNSCVLYTTAALIFHPPLAYLPSLSDVKMGRRPARCYRYCKNKPYPKSRFNRYNF